MKGQNPIVMNYSVLKLNDVNPRLKEKLSTYCYDIVGCCQQVHFELGPYLNEYMYQEALGILLEERGVAPFVREYYFTIDFHGRQLTHRHYVDYCVYDKVFVECKAIERIGPEQRQQLWNYMRLAKINVGLLFNFAPPKAQCERYYLDLEDGQMYAF